MAQYSHLIEVIFAAKNAGATKAEIEKVFQTMDKGTKTTTEASKKIGDFERALRRAAIVAPVWIALRTTMMSFMRGFSEGFKYMEDFDRAMVKAQAVSRGFLGTMGEAMDDLKGRIRNLSQETGESMTKIAAAFYQFGTIGMDFEKSWQGAEAAVRFALATQEDADKIARTLAMTFNILGDTVDKTIPPQQAMEVQLAKMYKLWQLNAGEAGDLTASLAAFLPTANTMNLTMDETIALLSTLNSAALLGSRGGRLLRTSFSKLIDNSDKLASDLGIYLNPQLDSTFTIMMKVLGATKQLYQAQKLPVAAQEVISNIFGGVRGGEPVKALIALYDQLQENLNISTKGYQDQTEALGDYKKRQEEVIGSVSNQLKLFRELRTQLFEQFITGATGADSFSEALQKINKVMQKLGEQALILGNKIRTGTTIPFMPHTLIPGIGIPGTKKEEKTTNEIKEIEVMQERIGKTITEWNNKNITSKKEEQKINDNILRKLDLQKRDLKTQLNIQKLINDGYTESDLLVADIANEVSNIVDQYNALDAVQNRVVPALSKQHILSLALWEDWEKILQLTNQQPFVQEKLLSLAKQVNQVELEKLKILEKQENKFTDIYAKYEEADMFERGRLRRLLELQNMTPRELGFAFEEKAYDKKLIMEYWNTFSQEGQKVIGNIIKDMYNLPTAEIKATITPGQLMSNLNRNIPGLPGKNTSIQPITNIVGANEVNVKVDLTGMPTPEEMAKLISKMVEDKCLKDDDFVKSFSKKISPQL